MLTLTADITARFDCVFWLGDLNSRLQKDRYQVDELIKGTENVSAELLSYDDIVQHDELKQAIDAGWCCHLLCYFQQGH